MSGKLSFALVGGGAIGRTYTQAIDRVDGVELTAVVDTRAEAAQELAQHCRVASFTDYKKLIESDSCDAVIVCTPPNSHAQICCDLLAAGIHVMCEKPMSIGSKDAILMADTANKHGVQLTMASKFRYVDDVIAAKHIVDSGILGDIVLWENAFTSFVDMRNRWNSDAKISGGGVLIDNGTHSLDLLRYFLGPLESVQVLEGKRSQGLSVEETVHIYGRATSGALGSIDLSWSINKELPSYINIHGSEGTIWIGWRESRYRQTANNEWVTFGHGYDKIQAFSNQIQNFADAIRGRDKLLINADDGIASVRAVEAAYASMRQDKWMPIDQAS